MVDGDPDALYERLLASTAQVLGFYEPLGRWY
jgi:hypothetical protein